jgi:hypothetical protein
MSDYNRLGAKKGGACDVGRLDFGGDVVSASSDGSESQVFLRNFFGLALHPGRLCIEN